MVEKIWKYVNGEGDDQERLETIQWIKADAVRTKEYHRIKRISALSGTATGVTDMHLQRVYQTIKHQTIGRRLWLKEGLKYAATVIITLGVALGVFKLVDTNPQKQMLTHTVIETLPGQSNEVTLPDGSKVWMNGDSRLEFDHDFSDRQRNVEFEGEGFFEVTKDAKRQFNVITKGMTVQVHGTSFNLEAYVGEKVITTLVEGKVALHTPTGEQIAFLKPGQQSVVQFNANTAQITNVDTEYYTSWKDGYLAFQNKRLEDVTPRLERLYNIEIVFKNEKVKQTRISGKALRFSPVDHLFKAFEVTYGIHYDLEVTLDKKRKVYIY